MKILKIRKGYIEFTNQRTDNKMVKGKKMEKPYALHRKLRIELYQLD